MFRTQALLILLLALSGFGADFSGTSALEFTRRAVAFGPRPAGSEANKQTQAYILSELRSFCKCLVAEDTFTADTPKGPVPMKNILVKFPGDSGRIVVVSGHYDTKLFPGRRFVGASDGGSSTGLLLELARVLARRPQTDDVYLIWFDGEEAVREHWEGMDNLYGSRHLASIWGQDGTAQRIKAMINVDMIGDRNLNIKREPTGNGGLNSVVWQVAADLGYSKFFMDESEAIDDDHMPFVRLGVPAIDLIDFDYPYWHEDSDTMDKLSAQSLEAVGRTVETTIEQLGRP